MKKYTRISSCFLAGCLALAFTLALSSNVEAKSPNGLLILAAGASAANNGDVNGFGYSGWVPTKSPYAPGTGPNGGPGTETLNPMTGTYSGYRGYGYHNGYHNRGYDNRGMNSDNSSSMNDGSSSGSGY